MFNMQPFLQSMFGCNPQGFGQQPGQHQGFGQGYNRPIMICRRCGRRGHLARACYATSTVDGVSLPSSTTANIGQNSPSPTEDTDTVIIRRIASHMGITTDATVTTKPVETAQTTSVQPQQQHGTKRARLEEEDMPVDVDQSDLERTLLKALEPTNAKLNDLSSDIQQVALSFRNGISHTNMRFGASEKASATNKHPSHEKAFDTCTGLNHLSTILMTIILSIPLATSHEILPAYIDQLHQQQITDFNFHDFPQDILNFLKSTQEGSTGTHPPHSAA